MGSYEINYLKYREGFAFIGTLGGSKPTEQKTSVVNTTASVTQIINVCVNMSKEGIHKILMKHNNLYIGEEQTAV